MERKTCKWGHAWIAENLVAVGIRGKDYRVCRLCANARSLKRNEERRRGALRPPGRPKSTQPLKTKCTRGHPLVEENIIRVGPRRQCRTCWIVRTIEKQHARKLREVRWLNLPRIEVKAFGRERWNAPKILPWSSVERSEYGPHRNRFNAYSRYFDTPWVEPESWQAILRQPRPSIDEIKADEIKRVRVLAQNARRTRKWRAKQAA